MKLSYALLAIAAATETTTNASVETTAPGTTESTAASITEASTAAAESTAAAASTAAATTTDSVETTVVDDAVAAEVDAAAAEACKKAQDDLADTTNSLEKLSATTACELVCNNVEGESCGFLVNGLSFVVFGILALFKY